MSSVAHIIRRRRRKKHYRRIADSRNRLWSGLIGGGLTLLLGVPLLLVLGVAALLYGRASQYLPSQSSTIYADPAIGTTEFYDRSGLTLIYAAQDPLGEERTWVELESLPPYVLQTTLMMEDPNFLEMARFDTGATLSQLWDYILGNPLTRDPSLTGRLVQNALLPQARASGLDESLLRIVLGAEVNRRYDAREILEWHLNTNSYGNDAYGIDAAAQVYLGKRARDLSLDEAAMLAAIPPAPQFNPFDNEIAARGRQADLLNNMLIRGMVTQDAFNTAASRLTPINSDVLQRARIAPDFALYARDQAEDILSSLGMDGPALVSRGGLRITTTLDLNLYEQSECVMRAQLARLSGGNAASITTESGQPCVASAFLPELSDVDRSRLPDENAMLLMDLNSGEIRSMVGDVTRANRQPGPTLYPFVYLQGFLSGLYTPATMLLDIPRSFPGPAEGLIYPPTNPDGVFRGPINLRDAMVAGLRVPAVSVADSQGLNTILASAHRIGLNTLDENVYDLTLLERGGQVSVLDMTYAYSVFGARGVMVGVDVEPIGRNYRARDPIAILEIRSADDELLWSYDSDRRALSRTLIFGADLAYMVSNILADQATRNRVLGLPESALNIGRPGAVVAGMTSNAAENWAVGYSPQLAMGVYMGRRDDTGMSLDIHGLQGSGAVWQAMMRYAHERDALPPASWPRPENIAEYRICERSGMTPRPDVQCPQRNEIFLTEVPPFQTDTYWQSVRVNSQTRQLATSYTPINLQIENIYFVPPTEAMDWWQSNGLPLPPRDYDTVSRPEALRSVQILAPTEFAYVGQQLDIRGSIDVPNLQSYQLSYGEGLNPTQWFNIGTEQNSFSPGTSMGIWDTSGLDGIYTIQLSVRLSDNSRDSDFVQVRVDNIAPQISLQAGEPGQIFRYPADQTLPIIAEASDNLAIDRVEFYNNGILIGVDQEWPYGFEFTLTRSGIEIFSATVFDQVGNAASTELSIEVLRSN